MNKVKNLGQVYTRNDIVKSMLSLRKNKGSILEPSAGDGSFYNILGNSCDYIEIDSSNYKKGYKIMDFFDYSINIKYNTIVGNPPYVSFKNILKETLDKISSLDYLNGYDKRTNLYMFFIRKCIEHLNEGGELIFITPREFIKNTSSIPLNKFIYDNGTITDWIEYGDEMVFDKFSPNVVVWRFEKGNFDRDTKLKNGEIKKFNCLNGQLCFTNEIYDVNFSDLFFVKVGGVSGNDKIFKNENGNKDFVCSYTNKTGELKRMFYNIKHPILEDHKEELLSRKIKKFTENNWWLWGRNFYESNEKRIYVNCKTRDKKPFFTNDCKNFDGSVLGIFPKKDIDLEKAITMLNSVDWDDLGFKIGGRFCFSQKSLENILLPKQFGKL